MEAEWVSALAAVVGAVGIIFVALQTSIAASQLKNQEQQLKKAAEQMSFAYKQMKNDHERSRREFTISLMRDWTLNLSHSSTIARKLVEGFSLEQCRAINTNDTLKVEGDKKEKLKAALQDVLEDRELIENNGFIVLEERDVAHLKFLLVTYLNTLETILMSWKLAVADKEILEQEFAYLVKPEEGHEALATFRKAVGGANAFPAIHAFVEKLKQNKLESVPADRSRIA